MNIALKAPFNPAWIDIKTRNTTLGALLKELSADLTLATTEFFDWENDDVYPDYDVHLNGQPYSDLVDSLDTKLKEGDKVEIIMIMLPGG